MRFLDGLKTAIGVVGTLVSILVPEVAPGVVQEVGQHVLGIVQGVFGALAALGVIHKIEKRSTK